MVLLIFPSWLGLQPFSRQLVAPVYNWWDPFDLHPSIACVGDVQQEGELLVWDNVLNFCCTGLGRTKVSSSLGMESRLQTQNPSPSTESYLTKKLKSRIPEEAVVIS